MRFLTSFGMTDKLLVIRSGGNFPVEIATAPSALNTAVIPSGVKETRDLPIFYWIQIKIIKHLVA